MNLRFLAFGSSEKDDPSNELSLERKLCVTSQYVFKGVVSPIFKPQASFSLPVLKFAAKRMLFLLLAAPPLKVQSVSQ